MGQWKHKSLEWIHSVREQDYHATKTLLPADLIIATRTEGEKIARMLGLKVVRATRDTGSTTHTKAVWKSTETQELSDEGKT